MDENLPLIVVGVMAIISLLVALCTPRDTGKTKSKGEWTATCPKCDVISSSDDTYAICKNCGKGRYLGSYLLSAHRDYEERYEYPVFSCFHCGDSSFIPTCSKCNANFRNGGYGVSIER